MKEQREGGFIILESAVALMFCVFILIFMLSFSFMLYQHVVVKTVATEAAQSVAEVYKFRNLSEAKNITEQDIKKIGKYRYLFFGEDFKRKNLAKVKTFADARLTGTTLAQKSGGMTVTLEMENDDIGRRHLEVKVHQSYTFLLGTLLRYVGFEKTHPLEAKAAVNDQDILFYINQVKLTKYGINKLKEVSTIFSMFNEAIKFWHEVFG